MITLGLNITMGLPHPQALHPYDSGNEASDKVLKVQGSLARLIASPYTMD